MFDPFVCGDPDLQIGGAQEHKGKKLDKASRTVAVSIRQVLMLHTLLCKIGTFALSCEAYLFWSSCVSIVHTKKSTDSGISGQEKCTDLVSIKKKTKSGRPGRNTHILMRINGAQLYRCAVQWKSKIEQLPDCSANGRPMQTVESGCVLYDSP